MGLDGINDNLWGHCKSMLASMTISSTGRAGGILFFSKSHSNSFKPGLGLEANNFVEFSAILFLLWLASEYNVNYLQKN